VCGSVSRGRSDQGKLGTYGRVVAASPSFLFHLFSAVRHAVTRCILRLFVHFAIFREVDHNLQTVPFIRPREPRHVPVPPNHGCSARLAGMVPIRLSSGTGAAPPRNLIGDAHAANGATFIPAVLGQLEHLFSENERAYGPC
jgi:hypothetical protein